MLQNNQEKKLWVLVSSVKENANDEDLQKIAPSVSNLIDKWQSNGKFVWSGPFNDNKTAMAVFAATKDEADKIYKQNDEISSEVLDSYLYQWDALPLPSLL